MKIRIELIGDDGKKYTGEVEMKLTSEAKGYLPPIKILKKERAKPKKINCTSILEMLWEKGVFREPNNFTQVKEVLDKEGYSFPDNTLSMALGSVDFLNRKGARRNYVWKQIYPYQKG